MADESSKPAFIKPLAISKRHPLLNWLLAILLMVSGLYLSVIEFAGIEWLSRSGCLIVVLGVWSSLGGIIQERLLISRLNFQHRINIARTKRKLRLLRVTEAHRDSELQLIADDFDDKTENEPNTCELTV